MLVAIIHDTHTSSLLRYAGVIWWLFVIGESYLIGMVRWGSKFKHHKITYLKVEIGLCLQILLTNSHSIMNTIKKAYVFNNGNNKRTLPITVFKLWEVWILIQFLLRLHYTSANAAIQIPFQRHQCSEHVMGVVLSAIWWPAHECLQKKLISTIPPYFSLLERQKCHEILKVCFATFSSWDSPLEFCQTPQVLKLPVEGNPITADATFQVLCIEAAIRV